MGAVPRKPSSIDLLSRINRPKLALPLAGAESAGGFTDFGLVTKLPATASVGDRCSFIAEKGNVIWELIYDGEGSFPWKKIGGPVLFNEVTTAESRKSTEYGALATAGPSITTPLKGDYDVEIGARLFSGPAGEDLFMSYSIGASAASDNDAVDWFGTGMNGNNSRPRRKTGLAASSALTAKYRSSGGGETKWSNRWMRVDAVRVG